nr:MAG TPA: hypothetical protein [Caudoviricetes sp.]DAZ39663.1 MAG TPA: hypothetical protein [Caudoviricetes sp.]
MCLWILYIKQTWKWGIKNIWIRKCKIYFKGKI